MNVVYVYADSPKEWNCSEWNCIIPTKAINKLEGHSASAIYINDFMANTEEAQKACGAADIIVVERNYFGNTLTMIQFWKSRNKTVIAIFDDAYDIILPANPSFEFWTKGMVDFKNDKGESMKGIMLPHPLEQFKWALKMVKAVQVPSFNLAKDWWIYNDTYYVHNYLDIDKYAPVEPLLPYDGITIGWCGSMSHHASFVDSGILDALRKVAKRNPEVRVLIGGDKRVFDMLKVENKVFQPYVPAEQWTALLSSLDIGLAPLVGEYDKRRSWIKVLEYLALRIPWVASDYITYSEFKGLGTMTKNGYLGWEKSLEEVIKNYPKYKELADTKGYAFALTQTSDINVKRVTLPLYEKLIKQPYPIDVRPAKETIPDLDSSE